MTKPTEWHVRPAIRVFACAQWVAKDPCFLHADSENSDQTGRFSYKYFSSIFWKISFEGEINNCYLNFIICLCTIFEFAAFLNM